jgi:hypothetical protein
MPEQVIYKPEEIHRDEVITFKNNQLKQIDQKHMKPDVRNCPWGVSAVHPDCLVNRFKKRDDEDADPKNISMPYIPE